MTTHLDHHYSITLNTSDLAVLQCLRALADYAQDTGNKRITWGGTKEQDWQSSDGDVTFRFSQVDYRRQFVIEAQRLLPAGSWRVVGQDDNDPATRQS